MHPNANLEGLMAGYQRGETDSTTALIRGVSPMLHRFFMVQAVSRRYADDLLQEPWLRIHEGRHTYRPGEPVLPWLYAIARHVRVDQYRKVRRVETREQQVEAIPDGPRQSYAGAGKGPDLEGILA